MKWLTRTWVSRAVGLAVPVTVILAVLSIWMPIPLWAVFIPVCLVAILFFGAGLAVALRSRRELP